MKAARPVRRGADGKVLHRSNSPAAYPTLLTRGHCSHPLDYFLSRGAHLQHPKGLTHLQHPKGLTHLQHPKVQHPKGLTHHRQFRAAPMTMGGRLPADVKGTLQNRE